MDAKWSIDLPDAFVVGEDDLKKLAKLLDERIGKTEFEADCSDDVKRSFKKLEDLIGFENPRGKEIRRLHMTSRSDDFMKRGTIDLSGSRWRGIHLEFEGRDDVVSRLRNEVLDLVAGMRPWYSVFQRFDFVLIVLLGSFLLWMGLMAVVASRPAPIPVSKESDFRREALVLLVTFGGIGGLFLFGILSNLFRDLLFPRAVFLIGQGKRRFQQTERVQWGIGISFVVSVIASAIVAVWQTLVANAAT